MDSNHELEGVLQNMKYRYLHCPFYSVFLIVWYHIVLYRALSYSMSFFSVQVTGYTVIVSTRSGSPGNFSDMPTWAAAKANPAIYAYQAVERCSDFTSLGSCSESRRKRRGYLSFAIIKQAAYEFSQTHKWR